MDSILISYPNGILYYDNKLIVGANGDNFLRYVDIKTRAVHNIAFLGEGAIDGIKKCGDDYLVSLCSGSLSLVKQNGEVTELLNTKDQKIFCADFEYIEDEKVVIVPTLWNNKLYGYRYEPEL